MQKKREQHSETGEWYAISEIQCDQINLQERIRLMRVPIRRYMTLFLFLCVCCAMQ